MNGGLGVLYVYGNYAGDNMNFDIAVESASEDGIETDTVRVWDDVASAPPDHFQDRRGLAADLFVIKVAGAKAETGASLTEVKRSAEKARDNSRPLQSRCPRQLSLRAANQHLRSRRTRCSLGSGRTASEA